MFYFTFYSFYQSIITYLQLVGPKQHMDPKENEFSMAHVWNPIEGILLHSCQHWRDDQSTETHLSMYRGSHIGTSEPLRPNVAVMQCKHPKTKRPKNAQVLDLKY